MAEFKSPRKKGEKIEQGVTTQDKGIYIPPEQREPTDPENLQRSKAQFVAHQKAKKEKTLELAKFSKEYDEKKRKGKETPAPAPEAPVAKKLKSKGKKKA